MADFESLLTRLVEHRVDFVRRPEEPLPSPRFSQGFRRLPCRRRSTCELQRRREPWRPDRLFWARHAGRL